MSADAKSLIVHLRSGVKFHDGTPLDAVAAVNILPDALRDFMGPVFDDVEGVRVTDNSTFEVRFRTASPFVLEGMEVPFRKPGPNVVGTGPYVAAPNSSTEMRANSDYYLGAPIIDRIVVSNYSSVRSAWAELLRDRIDMLFEVGADALESMAGSNNISTFTYTRHYQYTVALNTTAPALRSREIRRALNWAVDRSEIVRSALKDHGVASSGPLSSHYWALDRSAPKFEYDVKRATEILGSVQRTATKRSATLRFTCLVPPDDVNERVALELKRQLQNVGVDMAVEEATQDQIVQRTSKGQYDALLIELISGPTLFRPYLVWHSNAPLNFGHFGNATTDTALDRVRQAPSESAYRDAVAGLQQAFIDDPPAIFLAWTVRARAVSKRFSVQAEEGRDVMSTVRLWKPGSGYSQVSRN